VRNQRALVFARTRADGRRRAQTEPINSGSQSAPLRERRHECHARRRPAASQTLKPTCLEPGGACELAPEFSTDPLFRLYGWSIGLFGNKADKREKVAAAESNSARLIAMPVLDLAAEIMPAFGPDGINAKSGHRQGPMEVVSWLLPDASVKYRQPLIAPVIEALGVLEHANMLSRSSFGSRGQASTYRATRLGETALAEGTVRGELGTETH
jgi:hypothetical protein